MYDREDSAIATCLPLSDEVVRELDATAEDWALSTVACCSFSFAARTLALDLKVRCWVALDEVSAMSRVLSVMDAVGISDIGLVREDSAVFSFAFLDNCFEGLQGCGGAQRAMT